MGKPSPILRRPLLAHLLPLGWAHALEITLPRNYPGSAPSLAADVPYVCQLERSKNSRLKDVVLQFSEVFGEAYQVLSDPMRRKAYDGNGKSSISRENLLDATAVFTLLFGSEHFENYIGRPAVASMASHESIGENDKPENLQVKLKVVKVANFGAVMEIHWRSRLRVVMV